MTMHLAQNLTTVKTSRGKIRVTKAKISQWESEHVMFNKSAKKRHMPTVTFEEFLDIIHGRVKTDSKFAPVKASSNRAHLQMINHREQYPSVDIRKSSGICSKKEPQKYTGTFVKGLATTHKSNIVPVTSKEQAKDIARMRR